MRMGSRAAFWRARGVSVCECAASLLVTRVDARACHVQFIGRVILGPPHFCPRSKSNADHHARERVLVSGF